jgi:hypothetical protein
MGNDEDGSRASAVPLKQYLCDKFPSTKIFDHHQGYCHFQIMDRNVSLGLVFDAMIYCIHCAIIRLFTSSTVDRGFDKQTL